MKKILLASLLSIALLDAKVLLNKPLSQVILDNGSGYYDGKVWSSDMLKGKTTMLMYVDPDEKSKGENFKSTIEKMEKEFNFNKFQIVVMLNTGSTWKPTLIIKKLMKDKLKNYPKRVYVFDTKSKLAKEWGVKKDEYNVLLIDKDLKPIYSHSGKWTKDEIDKFFNLAKNSTK